MTDEQSAPPVPEPGPAAAMPPGPPTPSTARPVLRPPPRKEPPPPRPPSKLKAYLVIGIIVSSVVLVGLIGWRLYVRLSRTPPTVINISQKWDDAFSNAEAKWKEIFKFQAKVWTEGKELGPEEIDKIKAALALYEQTSQKFHELNDLALKEKKKHDMGQQLPLLKTWIWDANGVLDPASKPPRYGGLYIPMYQAEKRRETAAKRLKEIKEKSQEIVARKDAAEIEAVIMELRGLVDQFGGVRDELIQLDEDLLKGLTLPDLKKEQLRELGELRDYQNFASMGIRDAREVRSLFPSLEDLKAPPEAPKELPKEEPKEEPKPEQKEEPKKEPPKEQPPKEEPPKCSRSEFRAGAARTASSFALPASRRVLEAGSRRLEAALRSHNRARTHEIAH